MAKRQVVVVRPPVRRRAATAIVRVAGRGVRRVATAAVEEKHTLVAVGASLALGAAERANVRLPTVGGMSVPATYGIAAFLASRLVPQSRVLRHAATGLLSVAAYNLGRNQSLSVSGDMPVVGAVGTAVMFDEKEGE